MFSNSKKPRKSSSSSKLPIQNEKGKYKENAKKNAKGKLFLLAIWVYSCTIIEKKNIFANRF